MKRNLLLSGLLLINVFCFGQTKSVDLGNGASGTLATKITEEERTTLKELTVEGEINAVDFKFMRDELKVLEKLDIARTSITAFTGLGGTYGYEDENTEYEANHFPSSALERNTTIKEVIFPQNIIAIDYSACWGSQLEKADLSKITHLQSIESGAFSSCQYLTHISLPATITYISENTFYGSNALVSFTSNVSDPANILNGVFGMFGISYKIENGEYVYDDNGDLVVDKIIDAPEGCTLYVPAGSVDKYKTADTWKTFKNIQEIATEGKKNPAVSFAETSITKKPTDGKFTNPLTNTDNVTVTYSSSAPTVATIDATGEVTILDLGETVIKATTTETDKFNSIEVTYTLTISDDNLVSVETAGTLATKIAEADRATLKELILTGKLDARDFKFMRDQLPVLEKLNLENIDIERYLGSEGSYIFADGEKVEDVNYDAQQIPQFAFNDKKTLTEVVFPKNLFCVHEAAFAGSGLKKADFTNTKLGKIDGSATFSNCSELESITLPETMEWIAGRSFSNNGKLRAFTCLSADPTFITDGFKGMFEGGNAPERCSLYVPTEGVEAYKAAEDWKIFTNVKAIGSKEDPAISFAESAITKTSTDEAFTNTLANTDNVEVSYSSSNEEVATVDAQGKVTIIGVGETTIKAVTTETELFNSVEASYTLTVETANGIGEVRSNRMFVVTDGIQIEGEASVEVYTINGVLVEKAQVAGQLHIALNQGVYVVKLNDIIYKVIR